MAEDRRSAPAGSGRTPPEEVVTRAARRALGFAAQAVETSGENEFATLSAFAALCDRAADHMALAHSLLVAHADNAEAAAEHLDAALACLKEVVAQSTLHRAAASPGLSEAHSA